VFRLEDMAIDTIVVVAIMISAFILAHILTAIIGGWRQHRRAAIDQRQRPAQRCSRRREGWVPRG